jgi:hypothetical protein
MPTDQGTLRTTSVEALLADYAGILDELLHRGVIRSTNQPLGDYAEYLVAAALGLALAGNSTSGFDAIGPDGVRYQVKSRRLTAKNTSRQLGFMRGMDAQDDPFDVLVGILFGADFRVERAALVPIAVVRTRAVWVKHVNAWRMMLTDAVWEIPGVSDITDAIRAAATRPVGHPIETEPVPPRAPAVTTVEAPAHVRGSSQREFMRFLYLESGYDRDRTIERYAAAEGQGLVSRGRNRSGMSAEAYARALFADGTAKGWLALHDAYRHGMAPTGRG